MGLTVLHGITLGLLVITTVGSDQKLEPPAVFVDRGACPGECCTYGSWRAIHEVELFARPAKSSTSLGHVRAGSTVVALTGEVHTTAGKFVVRKPSHPYRTGDVIWVYTRLGEGWYRVWRAGNMVDQEISVAPDHQNPDDWGYYKLAPVSVWWVRIKLQDGRQGWTNAPELFSGTHSCG